MKLEIDCTERGFESDYKSYKVHIRNIPTHLDFNLGNQDVFT